MIKNVCLKYPNFKLPFIIITDASLQGLGACLSQRDKDGRLRPIAFASRRVNLAESRKPAVELETLAILFALKQYRSIILGYDVELETDHKPLVFLFKQHWRTGWITNSKKKGLEGK